MNRKRGCVGFVLFNFQCSEAKLRKYQGVFEVKSRVNTWQVRGIWSQICKSPNGGRNQVSGRNFDLKIFL